MKTLNKALVTFSVTGLSLVVALLLIQTLCYGQTARANLPVESSNTPVRSIRRAPKTITSLPSDFPNIIVTVPASNTADGYIFLDAFQWSFLDPKPSYLLILDNSGQPVYYQRLTPYPLGTGFDFGRQLGDRLVYFDQDTNRWNVLDSAYTITDSWQTTQGMIDHHDIQLLPNGHALLLATDSRSVDMSKIVPGGYPTATVVGFIVQELDQSKNVVFQWDSFDHFQITDAMHVSLTDTLIDYAHVNAIEPDLDGNLLISSRNMDEITKINRQTGDIIWRLGGSHNEFTFVNDPRGFSMQHDVRRLPNGYITIFDNGVFDDPQYSRAVEYEIDETQKVITMVREYRNTPDTYADTRGSVQLLPNGNTLVGWGNATPTVTEFRPDGSKAFELSFAPGPISYRAFRFTWHGRPANPPLLLAQLDKQTATLVLSWNGATDIQYYRIYAGTSPNPVTATVTETKTGFETVATFNNLAPGVHYYRFQAVDNIGDLSSYSNEVMLFVSSEHVFIPQLMDE